MTDVATFVDRVIDRDLGYIELIEAAEREAAHAEGTAYRGRPKRGSIDAYRKETAIENREAFGRLLFFLRHGAQPSSATAEDLTLYVRLATLLAAKGQYTAEGVAHTKSWVAIPRY